MSDIKYTGKNTLIYLLTLIKNNFVKKDGNKVLSDNNLTNELLAKIQNNDYASITSVSVNGNAVTPDGNKNVNIIIPDISTNITEDATSDVKTVSPKAVKTYVSEALADIQGIEYRILVEGEYANGVPTLASGEPGVIYLVPNSDNANNSYIEFIYDGTKFEKIGTTDVNLDGYLLESELVEFTNEEIDEIYQSLA
jgi:hypothetical protein